MPREEQPIYRIEWIYKGQYHRYRRTKRGVTRFLNAYASSPGRITVHRLTPSPLSNFGFGIVLESADSCTADEWLAGKRI